MDGGIAELDSTHAFYSAYPPSIYAIPLSGGPPALLSTEFATQMTLDDTSIYFTQWGQQLSDGTVFKIQKSGSQAISLAASQYQPGAIVVDDSHVYFARDDSYIMRVPKQGGAVAIVAAGAGYGAPQSLAIDDTHVYWTSNRDPPCGSVWKIAK